jgi:hypothetical protein
MSLQEVVWSSVSDEGCRKVMCGEVLLPFTTANNHLVANPASCTSTLSPEGGWLQRVGGRTSTVTAGSELGDATILVA